jgi:hypothetical protein
VPTFATENADSFWAAWDELRGDRPVPHYRDLFDGLASKLIPQLVILERASDGYVVRFVGTSVVELWGSDHTDDNISLILPEGFLKGLAPLLDLARAHPCGVSSLANVETGRGRSIQLDILILPIANDPGRPGRVAIFTGMVPARDGDALLAKTVERAKREWIDIGSGTPKTKLPS